MSLSRSPSQPQPSPCFGLAPMEGVSELPLRLWMSQTSAPPFMSTPFLRATEHFPRQLPVEFAPELSEFRELCTYELIPQVMTAEVASFVRTAHLFLEAGARFVDLNAGCPSPNPISGGAGSALLKDPKHFVRFLREITQQLSPGTVSLKMRTGFDDANTLLVCLPELARLPLRQLTLHGRTRRDRYDHHSRWDLIAMAARQLPYPVVASGDIVSFTSWQERARCFPEVQRVIVGRGALRNPWIFRELREQDQVALPWEVLALSLAVLGLLFQAYRTAPERLLTLVRSGIFLQSAGCSTEAWQNLYEQTCRAVLDAVLAPADLDFDRQTMGRLKMLFNSFRSSLPEFFLNPLWMRASRFSDWLEAWEDYPSKDQALVLSHHPSRDWIYTSSRRQHSQANDTAALAQELSQ